MKLDRTEIWLDTNIIIYYLTQHDQFSEPARQLVVEAGAGKYLLKISPLIISEVTYVMTGKIFRLEKTLVATALKSFINLKGIDCEEKMVIEEALDNFSRKNVDFADAYLAAHAKAVSPAHVISHNVKDFLKLGILVQTPGEILEEK